MGPQLGKLWVLFQAAETPDPFPGWRNSRSFSRLEQFWILFQSGKLWILFQAWEIPGSFSRLGKLQILFQVGKLQLLFQAGKLWILFQPQQFPSSQQIHGNPQKNPKFLPGLGVGRLFPNPRVTGKRRDEGCRSHWMLGKTRKNQEKTRKTQEKLG